MDPSMSMSEQMRKWSEDFIKKIEALEEENTTLKSRILELENKEKMSNSSEDPPRTEVRAKSGMNGSLMSISSEGVDSGDKEIHVKEEPVDDFIPHGVGDSDNLQTETPSLDEDEIDIKEEDVEYESRKSKSDLDNSLHDPALPVPPSLNVDQSSQIPIKNEIDKNIQRMFRSTEQVSNTEPATELGASGSRDLLLKKGLDTRSAHCESGISAVSNAPSSENSDSDGEESEDTNSSTNSESSAGSSDSSDSDSIDFDSEPPINTNRNYKKVLSTRCASRLDKNVTALCEGIESRCNVKSTSPSPSPRFRKSRAKGNEENGAFSFTLSTRAAGVRSPADPVQTLDKFLKEYSSGKSQFAKLTSGHGHLSSSSSPGKRKTPDCESPTNTSFFTDVDLPLSHENSKNTQGLPPKKKKIQATKSTSYLKVQETMIPNKETTGSSGVPQFGKTCIERVTIAPPPSMFRVLPVFGQKTKRGRSVICGAQDFSELYKNKHHKCVSRSCQKRILQIAVDTETLNANLTPSASSTRSVSETAKIIKKNSVDGINQDLGEDTTETLSSGVSPVVLNVSHPSVFIPDKTNYLKAGLFSKYYKTLIEGAPIPGQGSMQRAGCEGGQMSIPGRILPQPAYSSDYVTVRGMDFVLPYDIWCFGVLQARDKDHYEEWKREQEALKAQKKIQRRQRKLDAKGKSD